jgi:hypothetical protein
MPLWRSRKPGGTESNWNTSTPDLAADVNRLADNLDNIRGKSGKEVGQEANTGRIRHMLLSRRGINIVTCYRMW